MPSPFPGMDPYLESQGYWQDSHFRLIAWMSRELNAHLSRNYAALIEERISLVDLSEESTDTYRPDVSIVRNTGAAGQASQRGVAATLEPITLPLALEPLEEVRNRWIEIRRLPDRSLVTVIELLSPSNKTGSGRPEYIEKRNQWIRQPVHIVEIDLLLAGRRLPMKKPLPPADYYALVSRSDRRPQSDVYAWSIRRALPTIPIPLLPPDPDIPLALEPLFAQTYEDARYELLVDYTRSLDLPLVAADLEWAEMLGRESRPMK